MTVSLRVWGASDEDARFAESTARWKLKPGLVVVDVVASVGVPCPIPSRDRGAVAQQAWYDTAWAAYPAPLGVLGVSS